jgi:hypothetical protein
MAAFERSMARGSDLLFDDALWMEAEQDVRPRAVDSSDDQA